MGMERVFDFCYFAYPFCVLSDLLRYCIDIFTLTLGINVHNSTSNNRFHPASQNAAHQAPAKNRMGVLPV
jgi:hypothetical protein